MYKAVRMYTLLPGATDTFLQRVQESFVPLIGQQAGFLAYDARHVGPKRVRTISTFASRAGAEASVLPALRWAQERSTELMHGLPSLNVAQVGSASPALAAPHASHQRGDKTLVLDLTYEVVHPRALGEHAYADPHVRRMVRAIGNLLTQMRADPVGRDRVICRFEADMLPEEAVKSLYTADHVILIKRGANWPATPRSIEIRMPG